MKPDQQRVKNLLADTVTLLCKNGLTYKEELRIEGLVGITIDNNEVFLVHINESFSGASTNVKSATPAVTPALDLPGYLKSAENHTESTNNAHSVQHKPNRIACPRQTVPTSTNSPLQLSKAQGRKSPKLSHNSNVQSPSSVTATTENYDTGQAVKLEDDDDDDDVVIVSEVSNKRKHNNKTEEQEMDSSQNAIAQQAFPNVDFSALQDDQGFTDSLVDAGQSLSSKEPPMKRNRSQDDSQYMASIKHEQDTMTLDDSTSNQWENLTSMPGCSDWPGDDDSGLNQTQLGQTDAEVGSIFDSWDNIAFAKKQKEYAGSIDADNSPKVSLLVLPLGQEGMLVKEEQYSTICDVLEADKVHGAAILRELACDTLTPSHRSQMVRIITDALVMQTGTMYPKREQKIYLAKLLVSEFPNLATTIDGKEAYDVYYNSQGTGFIEVRLKTMRSTARRRNERKERELKATTDLLQMRHVEADIDLAESIRELIEADVTRGQAILAELDHGILTPTRRAQMVQIITDALVSQAGSLYPNRGQKVNMAKALVTEFPALCSISDGKEGYEVYYNSHGTGFIEMRLKTMRSSAKRRSVKSGLHTPTVRSRRKRRDVKESREIKSPSSIPDLTVEVAELVEFQKANTPTVDTTERFYDIYHQTFSYRRQLVKCIPPESYLQQFPRFIDLPKLIDDDFCAMYPHSYNNLLSEWDAGLKTKVISLGLIEHKIKDMRHEFINQNDDMHALSAMTMLLNRVYHLKRHGQDTSPRSSAPTSLVRFVESLSSPKHRHSVLMDQPWPHLIYTGQLYKPEQFHVVHSGHIIPMGDSIIKAFDHLFKTCVVLNLEYPSQLMEFYMLFACFVYCVNPSSEASSQIRSLAVSLGLGNLYKKTVLLMDKH